MDAPGGSTFLDLVGNVAEFVCDAPDAFDALSQGPPAAVAQRKTAAAMAGFAKSSADKLAVIGGSAFSDPSLEVTRPYPVNSPAEPYADVGFRLAFTAPAASVAERLKWVLDEQSYLPVTPVAGR